MIYWEACETYNEACQVLKYLTFEEFEDLLHAKEWKKYGKYGDNLHRACLWHMSLKKLNIVSWAKKLNHKIEPPKIECVRFGDAGEYVEYYWIDKGKRKKVCGYPKKGYRKEYVCLMGAGRGTLHKGYGYCMEHEKVLTSGERGKIWLQINKFHKKVPLLGELANRAEEVEKYSLDSMDSDLAYLELTRQAIMEKVETTGVFSREMTTDLSIVSDIMSKVKERKKKIEQMNFVPPEKVSAIILQVLDAVTKDEDPLVRRRIAMRAQQLSNVVVPMIEDAEFKIPDYEVDPDIENAKVRAEKYDVPWADAKEVSGYEVPKPPVVKKVPNYIKNHPMVNPKEKLKLELKVK